MSGQLRSIGWAMLVALLLALPVGCTTPTAAPAQETATPAPTDTATAEPDAESSAPLADETKPELASDASPSPSSTGAPPTLATVTSTGMLPTPATATSTGVPPTPATATSTLAGATAPVPTGLSVSGLVYWVTTPQSGVRVELRACANFATCPVLAETVTDAAGMYTFPNPPTTATQVFIYYPATGEYSATWISPPPFTVPVGGVVDNGTTHLVKDMNIISPPNDADVGRRVLLEWESKPSISRYRVLVFNADTDAKVADEYTTGTSTYVSLAPGVRYYWMVWAYVSDSAPPGYSTDRVWYYFNVTQ